MQRYWEGVWSVINITFLPVKQSISQPAGSIMGTVLSLLEYQLFRSTRKQEMGSHLWKIPWVTLLAIDGHVALGNPLNLTCLDFLLKITISNDFVRIPWDSVCKAICNIAYYSTLKYILAVRFDMYTSGRLNFYTQLVILYTINCSFD